MNNICENFNKCILDARGKSVLALLEGVRNFIMGRMQDKRGKMNKWHGLICPKVQNKIEEYKVAAKYCIPKWSGDQNYQFHCMQGGQYTVDLRTGNWYLQLWEVGFEWYSLPSCDICYLFQ